MRCEFCMKSTGHLAGCPNVYSKGTREYDEAKTEFQQVFAKGLLGQYLVSPSELDEIAWEQGRESRIKAHEIKLR